MPSRVNLAIILSLAKQSRDVTARHSV